MWKAVDKNGDKVLSEDEFKAFCVMLNKALNNENPNANPESWAKEFMVLSSQIFLFFSKAPEVRR